MCNVVITMVRCKCCLHRLVLFLPLENLQVQLFYFNCSWSIKESAKFRKYNWQSLVIINAMLGAPFHSHTADGQHGGIIDGMTHNGGIPPWSLGTSIIYYARSHWATGVHSFSQMWCLPQNMQLLNAMSRYSLGFATCKNTAVCVKTQCKRPLPFSTMYIN